MFIRCVLHRPLPVEFVHQYHDRYFPDSFRGHSLFFVHKDGIFFPNEAAIFVLSSRQFQTRTLVKVLNLYSLFFPTPRKDSRKKLYPIQIQSLKHLHILHKSFTELLVFNTYASLAFSVYCCPPFICI